jgi:peptide/nickel transport system substrate-binding protein
MKCDVQQLTAGLILFILFLAVAGQGAEAAGGAVLKIGTPNVVKSASPLGDSNFGVFTHLSNPTLMKMTSNGSVVGLTAKSYSVSSDGKT